MVDTDDNVLDSQMLSENISFLSDKHPKLFPKQAIPLKDIKEYLLEYDNKNERKNISCKTNHNSQNSSILNTTLNKSNISQVGKRDKIVDKNLKAWGLPKEIVSKYEEKGVIEMFDWQVQCLANPKILFESRNLVYSAPTSAGKTLVAEILTIKTILERQKKVIIILPFVSIVREKMFYLQDILSSSGIRVEGFVGSQSPPGGLQAVHVAICTIEKANSLINRLLDEGKINELGAIIVDELHLLGDPHRGYILELLLTKIKYVCSKSDDLQIQVIGMSATLPNLEILAHWLEAELFVTEFRPIPLDEYCLVENKLYNKQGILEKEYPYQLTADGVLRISLDTIKQGCSVLIFCMTKNRCEALAQSIASSFYNIGCQQSDDSTALRNQLNPETITEVLEQLKNCPVNLDQILKKTISFGVAYHHAGLTFDERDIIEGAFKSGAIRVLIATSTLSSGVNLPARTVIVRSPVFLKNPINTLTYKQMIGRAGRMGKDTKGESILICEKREKQIGFALMMGTLDPVTSCIGSENKYMRAVLEIIASQDTCSKTELEIYSKCTLLHSQNNDEEYALLNKVLKELLASELIRNQDDGIKSCYIATPLGKACLSASMAPDDGLSLFVELQKARQCLVLENDLHLIYLVTPYSVSDQWGDIDWLHFLSLWESSTKATKKIGELVGIKYYNILNCVRNSSKISSTEIYSRFYTALALKDLVNEVPLSEVATKFQRPRGFLQSLQQAAATFAGMVTAFCRQLGWKNMEILISQFQDRLHFGVSSELLDLMKLPSLNGVRARALFDSGFETVSSIASAEVNIIENVLYKSVPFQSEKQREDDDKDDVRKRNKLKTIWITGCCGMTVKEAAQNLIAEARKHVETQIGVNEIKWDNKTENSPTDSEDKAVNCENSELVVPIKVEVDDDEQVIIEDQNTVNSESRLKQNRISEDFLNSSTEIIKNDNVENLIECKKEDELTTSVNHVKSNRLSENFLDDSDEIIQDQSGKYYYVEALNEKNQSTPVLYESPLSMNTAIKDDIVWDSLEFTETAIQNITKHPNYVKNSSPIINFDDTNSEQTENNTGTSKNLIQPSTSVKDVSLFSTDGDNSSLFDESLPVDLIPTKIFDNNNSNSLATTKIIRKETAADFADINSETISKVFKSPITVNETLKADISQSKINENEVVSSQETMSIHSFKSPYKRTLADKSHEVTVIKKQKVKSSNLGKSSSNLPDLMKMNANIRTIKFHNHTIRCVFMNEINVYNFFKSKNIKKAGAFFILNEKVPSVKIGANIQDQAPKLDNKDEPIKGLALYVGDDTCYYLDMTTFVCNIELLKERRRSWFLEENVVLRSLYLSSQYKNFKEWLGTNTIPSFYDIGIIERILFGKEKGTQGPTIFSMVEKYCGINITTIPMIVDNVIQMYKNFDEKLNACLKAWSVWQIAEKQQLSPDYKGLPCKVISTEFQTSVILATSEEYGIEIDRNYVTEILTKVKEALEILQKKANTIAGRSLPMNSPTQVAMALNFFQRGKAKRTNKAVLSCHSSPLASVVMYWRKLNHALTQTLYPLIEESANCSENSKINNLDTSRIYPKYTMDTLTGRISMHEPNLQNVPRTFIIPSKHLNSQNDVEFNIRHAFKVRPGYVMVSADYCQLEMRVLTHFSEDKELMKIMNSDTDVFKRIAASWCDVPEDQVDDDLRHKAKQMCYGVLYGMTNATLARNLNVTELEAGQLVYQFHVNFRDIQLFRLIVNGKCQRNGYVQTLMKRRRYFADIKAIDSTEGLRSAAQRQALNTTIQGSAADIAKAAMCAIDNKTKTMDPKPRLLLQMHDELIYEVHEKIKDEFVKVMKEAMEGTIKLKVPLPVRVKSGYSWGSLTDYN